MAMGSAARAERQGRDEAKRERTFGARRPPPHPASPKVRLVMVLVVAVLGVLLFGWQLGATGLVDETPPLFAASARAMAETGDWLIPRVNGLPRYDKPPLVYWLMGLIYALPDQESWNPLGTWAARFPSALASVMVMVLLVHTLLRWPQPGLGASPAPHVHDRALPRAAPASAGETVITALTAPLAFALSPLVLLWGRTAVSDALLTALVAFSLLLCWQTYASPGRPWWPPWLVLGLAVLTKGPVAVALLALTLVLFGWLQVDMNGLVRRLQPLRGLLLTALVAFPWYGLALLREGRPLWDSFIGYHNVQRFTSVVNNHLQPWWFFFVLMLVASVPFTPLLLLAIPRAVGRLRLGLSAAEPLPPAESLGRFAACWLLAVLLFFTMAATKLPSYWLPATPAAALLIALACQGRRREAPVPGVEDRWAWRLTLLLTFFMGAVFLAAPLWVPLIQDPELPTLPARLLASGRLWLAGALYVSAAAVGWLGSLRRPTMGLLGLQLVLLPFVPGVLLPLWGMGDQLRGQPVRAMAAAVSRYVQPDEAVAMVGILKPSLHYYSRRVVIYEGNRPLGLVNLADRLVREARPGQPSQPAERQPTLLVVIDQTTASLPFWRGLEPRELDRSGLYRLWRMDRRRLARRADRLRAAGHAPDWQEPVPERY